MRGQSRRAAWCSRTLSSSCGERGRVWMTKGFCGSRDHEGRAWQMRIEQRGWPCAGSFLACCARRGIEAADAGTSGGVKDEEGFAGAEDVDMEGGANDEAGPSGEGRGWCMRGVPVDGQRMRFFSRAGGGLSQPRSPLTRPAVSWLPCRRWEGKAVPEKGRGHRRARRDAAAAQPRAGDRHGGEGGRPGPGIRFDVAAVRAEGACEALRRTTAAHRLFLPWLRLALLGALSQNPRLTCPWPPCPKGEGGAVGADPMGGPQQRHEEGGGAGGGGRSVRGVAPAWRRQHGGEPPPGLVR